MLVICAGRSAGFQVRTEVRVSCANPNGNLVNGEIDIGWYMDEELVVALEVDGQDAGMAHFLGNLKKGTAGNAAKFRASGASHKIQVLYSLKNSLASKGSSKINSIGGWLNNTASIVTDEQLMLPHGIESLINRVKALGT